MKTTCPECGAPVPEGGSCRDNFDALLLLEAGVPGGPGEAPHYFAVRRFASRVIAGPIKVRAACFALVLAAPRRYVGEGKMRLKSGLSRRR